MKKVILVMAVAALFAFTGSVMASPPVCPPFEGFFIETDTVVSVQGNLEEEENFEWQWNNDSCRGTTNDSADGNLAAAESVGRITYSEDFDSFNGVEATATTLDKTFTAQTHQGDNNVVVEKDIGFTSDGVAGHKADLIEKASLEIVSAGGPLTVTAADFAGVLALCPWSTPGSRVNWPATNEGIAMGSGFHIPPTVGTDGVLGEVTFGSDTTVTGTQGPVGMYYNVDAEGNGTMEAQMVARLWEGSAPATTLNPTPALNSVATYEEYVKADGIFDFHKDMTYRAQFGGADVTPVNVEILP